MQTRPASLWAATSHLVMAFLLASIGVTLLAGLGTLLGWDDPARTGRKALVPLVVVCWIAWSRSRLSDLPKDLGWASPTGKLRAAGMGLVLGALPLLVLNGGLLFYGARVWEPDRGLGPWLLKVVLYLLQALGLAVLEETLFRGVLHRQLRRGTSAVGAIALGSFVFSVAHFLRPPKDRITAAWWDTMPACFDGVAEAFGPRWRESVGLFLVGVVLAALRERRGHIFASIGVHAGWVWIRFVSSMSLEEVKEVVRPHLTVLGSMRLYDGALGWGALVLTGVLAFVGRPTPTVAEPDTIDS